MSASKVFPDIDPDSFTARIKWHVKEYVADVGLYVRGGEVYMVRPAKADPNRVYALYLGRLDGEGGYCREYVQGKQHVVRPEDRMTRGQAIQFGNAHNRCAWCGYGLTDPESIRRGMGPTCYRAVFSRRRD